MANKDHLALLIKGVAAWNEWRKKNPKIRPDLSGADLRGANLGGANLRGAYLREAILSAANFSLADLRGVNLKEVKNLTREQLEKAQTDEKTILPDYL